MPNTTSYQNPFSDILSRSKKLGDRIVRSVVYRLMPIYRSRLLSKWPRHSEILKGFQLLVFRAVGERVMSEYYQPATSTQRREQLTNQYHANV